MMPIVNPTAEQYDQQQTVTKAVSLIDDERHNGLHLFTIQPDQHINVRQQLQ